MSTVTDLAPPPEGTVPGVVTPARRGRRVLAVLLGVVVLLAALAGIASAALYAWDSGYEGRVLPGVSAGGVDLSGMAGEEAAAALAARYPFEEGRLVLRTPDGDVTIPYAELGRRADTDAVVQAAMTSGRESDLIDRTVAEVRQALQGASLLAPAVLVDGAEVRRRVEAAVLALRRPPVAATIAMTADGIVIGRARTGRGAEPEPVVRAALVALADSSSPVEIVIPVATSVIRPPVEDAAVFDARTQAVRMAKTVKVGTKKQTWSIKAGEVRSWIRFEPATGGRISVVVDRSQIPANFKKAAKAVKKPAQDAQYLRARNGTIVGVIASSAGRKLDRSATVSRVIKELRARADGAAPAKVRVAVATVAPRVGTEEAARKAPVLTLLGSWQTWFPISERNYNGANIWVPASLINGTVLKPGQSFDWWDAIWPVTPARGFGPGGFIAGDHTEPTGALGGGMCSSSTTLFNAAMRAGLDMGARSNHKYYISRYPLGLDATVSITAGGRQTMSFRNDMKHLVYIRGTRIRSGGTGWVRYEIWGVPDGRTVSISRPSVSNVSTATTKTVYVDTLPKGEKEQVEYASDGMTTAVTRVVRDGNGRVLHRDTWVSRYVRWNGIINVGR
jgi:vancomycin resistance protein YoaR